MMSDPRPDTDRANSKADNDHVLTMLARDYLRERRARRRWGLFFRFLLVAWIGIGTWLYFASEHDGVDQAHTALVVIDGIIGPGEISAPRVIDSLEEAFSDEYSRAVVIKINSPGGTPVQAAQINEEITRLQALYPDKPAYAAIADIGASGGYYIAVAADKIFAHRSSIVGSIGVLMNGFGFAGAIEKLGIERRLLTAGKNKALLDPFSPANPDDLVFVQQMLDAIHQDFIAAVKRGRKDRLRDDPDIFSGLVWSGRQARELGLIDDFGSEQSIARDIVGASMLVDYTYRPSAWREWVDQTSVSISNALYNRFFTLR